MEYFDVLNENGEFTGKSKELQTKQVHGTS